MFKTTQITFASTIRSTNRRIRKLRIARYKIQKKATVNYLQKNKDKYGYQVYEKYSQERPEYEFMKQIQKDPWERNVRLPKRSVEARLAQLQDEEEIYNDEDLYQVREASNVEANLHQEAVDQKAQVKQQV